MATTTISTLPDLSLPIKPNDLLHVRTESGLDRKLTFAQLLGGMGFASFLFAVLPVGFAGGMIFVRNGLKSGEISGSGSGVLCSWNGSNWITVDTGSTVAV